MNILVTGAAGYIVDKIVKALCRKDWVDTVVGTDIREPLYKHPKYIFDMRDVRHAVDDILRFGKLIPWSTRHIFCRPFTTKG